MTTGFRKFWEDAAAADLEVVSGYQLDALAGLLGVERRQLPGGWIARTWRRLRRAPAPLEPDAELRERCREVCRAMANGCTS
jgi:hypothetical protein